MQRKAAAVRWLSMLGAVVDAETGEEFGRFGLQAGGRPQQCCVGSVYHIRDGDEHAIRVESHIELHGVSGLYENAQIAAEGEAHGIRGVALINDRGGGIQFVEQVLQHPSAGLAF